MQTKITTIATTRPTLRVNTKLKAGKITVYGSPTCPWCTKQTDYLTSKKIPFKFVDCSTEACPDIVKGFPTTVIEGYHEF